MTKKTETTLKILAAIAPLFVSCILLAAQWGAVNAEMLSLREDLSETKQDLKEAESRWDQRHEKTLLLLEKTSDSMTQLQIDVARIMVMIEKKVSK